MQDLDLGPGGEACRETDCGECRIIGITGRQDVFELPTLNGKFRTLILGRASAGRILRSAKEDGPVLPREDGWKKVRNGITPIQEIVRATKGRSPT